MALGMATAAWHLWVLAGVRAGDVMEFLNCASKLKTQKLNNGSENMRIFDSLAQLHRLSLNVKASNFSSMSGIMRKELGF